MSVRASENKLHLFKGGIPVDVFAFFVDIAGFALGVHRRNEIPQRVVMCGQPFFLPVLQFLQPSVFGAIHPTREKHGGYRENGIINYPTRIILLKILEKRVLFIFLPIEFIQLKVRDRHKEFKAGHSLFFLQISKKRGVGYGCYCELFKLLWVGRVSLSSPHNEVPQLDRERHDKNAHFRRDNSPNAVS